jgi:2-methylaconitate cis-trans-isomerase PrpF
MPSGVLNVGAEVVRSKGTWTATRGAFYAPRRRLFDGFVYV